MTTRACSPASEGPSPISRLSRLGRGPGLLRVSLRVDVSQVERAIAAWEQAGIFNSSVEYEVGEPVEEPWPGYDHRTERAEVVAYLSDEQWREIESLARESAEQLLTHDQLFHVKQLPNRDWRTAWHDYFDIVRVTPQQRAASTIVIRPPQIAYQPQPEEVVIDLAPGLAFGTGQHQSTRLCLGLLAEYVWEGASLLDVGTGSGVLAAAAAKLGAGSVLATDIDPLAVDAARDTVRRNQLDDLVTAQRGSVPTDQKGQFDLVSANLTADILQSLASELARALRPSGRLIASGLIIDRRDEVAEMLARVGLTVIDQRQEDEWVGLVCQSPAAS